MSFQPGANLYTQGFGSRPEDVEVPHIESRAPATTDIIYSIGKRWVNSAAGNVYELAQKSVSQGVTTATWAFLGSTTGDLNTLTTDDMTVVVPTAGNINLAGSGSTTTTGSGSTATVALTGLTNHNVLVGAGTATITKVAPSATSGVPLVSAGAAADPAFGTAVVAGGGTGAVTLGAHGVLIGEGTSPVVATTAGSNGQVLLGSTGADPAFGTLTSSDSSVTFTTGAASLGLTVGNTLIGKASVTLTSTQIKALRATPIQLVAAPATGKTLHYMGAQLKFVYAGTNAFTNPQNLAVKYTNGSGVVVGSAITAAGFLDGTASEYTSDVQVANAIVAATAAEAQALVIHNTGGSEITGNAANDNTIVVTVYYATLTQ